MKKLILIASLFIAFTAQAQQHITKDANGNYTVTKQDTTNKATGKTITLADGKVLPLYLSVHGKLFYNRVSKAGNVYKVYIKTE